eukprot:PhF_6_TR36217/c0_g1_i2/m.52864
MCSFFPTSSKNRNIPTPRVNNLERKKMMNLIHHGHREGISIQTSSPQSCSEIYAQYHKTLSSPSHDTALLIQSLKRFHSQLNEHRCNIGLKTQTRICGADNIFTKGTPTRKPMNIDSDVQFDAWMRKSQWFLQLPYVMPVFLEDSIKCNGMDQAVIREPAQHGRASKGLMPYVTIENGCLSSDPSGYTLNGYFASESSEVGYHQLSTIHDETLRQENNLVIWARSSPGVCVFPSTVLVHPVRDSIDNVGKVIHRLAAIEMLLAQLGISDDDDSSLAQG